MIFINTTYEAISHKLGIVGLNYLGVMILSFLCSYRAVGNPYDGPIPFSAYEWEHFNLRFTSANWRSF